MQIKRALMLCWMLQKCSSHIAFDNISKKQTLCLCVYAVNFACLEAYLASRYFITGIFKQPHYIRLIITIKLTLYWHNLS